MIKSKYILCAAAVFTACLASCSQEDFPINEPGGSQPLAITVTDGGYASETPSRATENGYHTDFKGGDRCGLFIVENGKLVVNNAAIYAIKIDGVLQWKVSGGKEIRVDDIANASFYLYYPHRPDMSISLVPASDDASFFAPLIEQWKPKADQSDYDNGYTASDLMTAKGILTGNTVSFNMTHRMALTVIGIPGTIYKFTDSSIPDYIVPGIAEFTSDAKPCRMVDGTYRYLINPVTEQQEIIGNYDNGKKEFTISPTDLTYSKYKTYKVDGGILAGAEKAYSLQAGDYFCSNANRSGWYVIPKDIDPAENDNCIGIVFATGKNSNDKSDYAKPLTTSAHTVGDTFHGYVVALTDAHRDGTDILTWECGTNNESNKNVDASNIVTDWNGYYNCMKVHEFVNKNDGWEMKHFPAFLACETYGNRTLNAYGNPTSDYGWQEPFVAPANTSGWFLPSIGQLRTLHFSKQLLSRQIEKIKYYPSHAVRINYIMWLTASCNYWTSSESGASNAYYMNSNTGSLKSFPKNRQLYVRAILAF